MSDLDGVFDKAKQSMALFEKLREEAAGALEKARDELAKTKKELEEVGKTLADAKHNHQGLLSEIAAKQAAVDTANEEAARRIKTGNEQATELMRVKEELAEQAADVQHKTVELAKKERDLVHIAKELSDKEFDYVKRNEALAAREQKLKEAMS
jgi:chromosome segregation ATPase